MNHSNDLVPLARRPTGLKLVGTASMVAARYLWQTDDYLDRVADVEEMLGLPQGSILAEALREGLGSEAEAHATRFAQVATEASRCLQQPSSGESTE